jgi:hypothetical protein
MLPEGLERWETAGPGGYSVARAAAGAGKLPGCFGRWEITDGKGWPVAHEAARPAKLPAGFKGGDLADCRGKTVTHIAFASCKHFSKNFALWDMTDNNGWSVAHEAAMNERLPWGFSLWDLAESSGRTVSRAEAAGGGQEKRLSRGPARGRP